MKKSQVIKVCEICGNPFSVKQSKQNTARFCSLRCRGQWWGKICGKRDVVERQCLSCGKIFIANYSAKLFCSRRCMGYYRKSQYEGEGNPRWNGGKVLCHCQNCGEVFHAWPGRNRKFCSYNCKQQSMIGGGNYNWHGGLSFEPYTIEFNRQLKEMIRNRDGNKCQLCEVPEMELIEKLCIHHIDYDKNNCLPSNLISLCRSCHAKVNFNRQYWQTKFQDYTGKQAVRIYDN